MKYRKACPIGKANNSFNFIVVFLLLQTNYYVVNGVGEPCVSPFDCPDHDPCEMCAPCIIIFPAASGTCGAPSPCIQGEPCDVTNSCLVCDNDMDCEPMDCSFAETPDPCTTARCIMGNCVLVDNNDPCDDMSACTLNDECVGGLCVGGDDFSCPDTDPSDCMIDMCVDMGGVPVCVQTPVANGEDCDDGDPCTANECQGGVCIVTGPTDCDDGIGCTIDSCVLPMGCVNMPDNTLCNDFLSCTDNICDPMNDCIFTPNDASCDDGVFCTLDKCSLAVDCLNTPLNSRCDNGDICDGAEKCIPGHPMADAAGCVPGVPFNCDDQNECTDDSCVPGFGCVNDGAPNEGAPCDDDDACTLGETCMNGNCGGGADRDCEVEMPPIEPLCQRSICDSDTGCELENFVDGTICETDDNICNGIDICIAGVCTPQPGLVCDDGNDCTDDPCDPIEGCLPPVIDNTNSCDDNNVCTQTDVCVNGVCVGTDPLICDDMDPCTDNNCVPDSGCDFSVFNEDPCDDGDPCTGGDRCDGAGNCVGFFLCNDANPCTVDACTLLGCTNTPVADDTPCSDGALCNGLETCQMGVCTPGVPLICNANEGNPCIEDFCDNILGCQTKGPGGMPDECGVCNGPGPPCTSPLVKTILFFIAMGLVAVAIIIGVYTCLKVKRDPLPYNLEGRQRERDTAYSIWERSRYDDLYTAANDTRRRRQQSQS